MDKAVLRLIFFVMPLVMLVGCAAEERPEGMPELYPCTLTLTQGGQPLAGATVEVVGVDSTEWSAGGSTDESGKVELVTYGKYKGVAAGKHKVAVNKRESETADAGVEQEGGIVLSDGGGSLPESFTLVETQYTSRETTPLELEITPDGDNDQTFECGEPVREPI